MGIFSITLASLIEVDIVRSFLMSDIIGKIIVIVIAIFSIVSWSIIGFKYIQITSSHKQTKAFVRNCREKYGSLEDAYQLSRRYSNSPLARMIKDLYLEFEFEKWSKIEKETRKNIYENQQATMYIENVEKVIDKSITNEITNLEKYLNILSTTGNICPLLGILGTVWGILAAFQNIAVHGTADFTTLSSGVSTALLTTVVGLVAAIPAIIFYNHFVNKNNEIISDMDIFANELSTIIRRRFGGI